MKVLLVNTPQSPKLKGGDTLPDGEDRRGFECYALLRDNLGRYDFFCYLEDDLLIHDPWFFAKQKFFNLRAGNEYLLQPNRYEVEYGGAGGGLASSSNGGSDLEVGPTGRSDWEIRPTGDAWAPRTRPTLHGYCDARGGRGGPAAAAALSHPTIQKTYIDGDLDERLVRKWQNIDEQPELALISMGVPIPCRRTLNPHCGGFFLNAEQMEHWSRQQHFLERDRRPARTLVPAS